MQRKRKRSKTRRHRQSVKQQVITREQGQCYAFGVSRVCTRVAIDRHELVPLGLGGKVTRANCVATCRACHDAAHGEPFHGVRLIYEWQGKVGKAGGTPPNADEPGNVRPVWVDPMAA